jgi:hypothetical protein
VRLVTSFSDSYLGWADSSPAPLPPALNVQLTKAVDDAQADGAALNAAIQALQAPLDSSLAQIIVGANTIAKGVSSLLRAALLVRNTLQNLTTVNGVASSLQSLVTSLGLTNIRSALGL